MLVFLFNVRARALTEVAASDISGSSRKPVRSMAQGGTPRNASHDAPSYAWSQQSARISSFAVVLSEAFSSLYTRPVFCSHYQAKQSFTRGSGHYRPYHFDLFHRGMSSLISVHTLEFFVVLCNLVSDINFCYPACSRTYARLEDTRSTRFHHKPVLARRDELLVLTVRSLLRKERSVDSRCQIKENSRDRR